MKTRLLIIATALLLFGWDLAQAQFTGGIGRGDSMGTLELIDTSIDQQEAPISMKLHQNYPNPFNPVTQIQYVLPEATEVRLEVFNLMGQRVATLVNTTQAAGTYSETFDASSLSSGMYVYRLSAGSFVQTRKMVLVK